MTRYDTTVSSDLKILSGYIYSILCIYSYCLRVKSLLVNQEFLKGKKKKTFKRLVSRRRKKVYISQLQELASFMPIVALYVRTPVYSNRQLVKEESQRTAARQVPDRIFAYSSSRLFIGQIERIIRSYRCSQVQREEMYRKLVLLKDSKYIRCTIFSRAKLLQIQIML